MKFLLCVLTALGSLSTVSPMNNANSEPVKKIRRLGEKRKQLEDLHYPWGDFVDNLRISSVTTTSPGCTIYPNDCLGTNKPLCCKSNNGNDKYQCTDSVESCQPGPASANACNTTLHHGDINETSSCLRDEGTVCCITTIGGGEHNRNCTANEIVSKNLWQVVSDIK